MLPERSEFIARIRREVGTLSHEFEGVFGIETIQRCADDGAAKFRDARLPEYVPLLVYKLTRERLRALAQAEGLVTKDKPEILFVCVHDAGRSQMAAVLSVAFEPGARERAVRRLYARR